MAKKRKTAKRKSFLKGKVVIRKILRKGKRPTLTIKEHEPAPYIPIYIKEQIKEDRRQFYFK